MIPKGYGLASLEHLDEGFLSEYARLGGVPARKEASLACVIRVQEGVLFQSIDEPSNIILWHDDSPVCDRAVAAVVQFGTLSYVSDSLSLSMIDSWTASSSSQVGLALIVRSDNVPSNTPRPSPTRGSNSTSYQPPSASPMYYNSSASTSQGASSSPSPSSSQGASSSYNPSPSPSVSRRFYGSSSPTPSVTRSPNTFTCCKYYDEYIQYENTLCQKMPLSCPFVVGNEPIGNYTAPSCTECNQ